LTLAFLASAAMRPAAQTKALTVRGDRFLVDGQEKFLLFVSYFDALRLASAGGDVGADLEYIRSLGYDGVRILPNWFKYCAREGSPEEFPGDGLFSTTAIQEPQWAAFKSILDAASARGLLVDVTFTRETITGRQNGVAIEAYRDQIAEVARRLKDDAAAGGYRHVFFDLQNEYDNNGVTIDEIRDVIVPAVRKADPLRLLTASTSGGRHALAGEAVTTAGLDFAGVHSDRSGSSWCMEPTIAGAIDQAKRAMGSRLRPVQLQEPKPFSFACGNPKQEHDASVERHVEAAVNAKRLGAAAWTFHTRTTFDLAAGRYQTKIAGSSEAKALAAVAAAVGGKVQ
jgi:hypothetical protein